MRKKKLKSTRFYNFERAPGKSTFLNIAALALEAGDNHKIFLKR